MLRVLVPLVAAIPAAAAAPLNGDAVPQAAPTTRVTATPMRPKPKPAVSPSRAAVPRDSLGEEFYRFMAEQGDQELLRMQFESFLKEAHPQ
jgi:hypothetical protein